MAPNWTWTHSKYPLYTKYFLYNSILTPEAQILVGFALQVVVFKAQGHQQSEMYRITPALEHLIVKGTLYIYTKYLPLVPKTWSVSLYNQQFRRYHTFYNSPLTPMLNAPQNRTKKMPKIRNWNLTILYTTLVGTLPRSMPELWGTYLLCTFTQDLVLFLSPILSHVNANKKI